MNELSLEHPAIKEMIGRRSDGNRDYVAGVRAYLTQGKEPAEGTIACRGYFDAHDMTEYLATTLADLRADLLEEETKFFLLRKKSAGERLAALQKATGVSIRATGIKPRPGQCIQI